MAKTTRTTSEVVLEQPKTPLEIVPPTETPTFEDPENVMGSKRYVKGLVEYLAPATIIQPILTELKAHHLKPVLSADKPVIVGDEGQTQHRAYGRINVVTSIHIDDEITYELGILTALDIAKPQIQIYQGPRVRACLNLCIFEAQHVTTFLLTNTPDWSILTNYITTQTDRIKNAIETIQTMKTRKITIPEVHRAIGHMLFEVQGQRKGAGENAITYGMTLMKDDRHKYSFRNPDFNHWTFYNALTEYYGAKKIDLFDVPDKVLDTSVLLNNALGLN